LPTPAANKPLRAASRVGYVMRYSQRVEGRKWMFVLGWEEEDRVGPRCRGGTLSPSNSLYFFTILSNLRFITPRPPSSSSSAVRAGKAQAMAVKTSSQVLKRDQAEITPMGCREELTPKCAGGAPKGQPRLCSNEQPLVQCHLPSPSLVENAMRHAPCARDSNPLCPGRCYLCSCQP